LKRRWIATSVVGVVAAAVALTSTVAQAAEARDYVVLGDSYASERVVIPRRDLR
jgi:hypothetical protein